VIIVVEKIHFFVKAGVATPQITARCNDPKNNDASMKPVEINAKSVFKKGTGRARHANHARCVNYVCHVIPNFFVTSIKHHSAQKVLLNCVLPQWF
jgi:hypothetical protein